MTKTNRTTARRGWVLRKLSLTRLRQKAWRDQPEKMEGIRKQATEKAKAIKDEKNQNLINLLSTWPERLTCDELKEIVARDIDYKGNYSSLTYRFTRKGLLRFEADGHWHNLCHLPAE